MDLGGPKIRTGRFRDGAVELVTGSTVTVTTADVLQALSDSAPISRLMQERITALRAWARERCRFVDDPEAC